MYTTVLFSLTGGNLLQLVPRPVGASRRSSEAERTGADAYDLLLGRHGRRADRSLVLPYFTPSGTPYFDAKMPGAILGLRLATTRGQVLRALLEGVALEMRLNVDILEAGRARRPRVSGHRRRGEEPGADATEGRRPGPAHHHAGRHRGRLPGRGHAGLRGRHAAPRRTAARRHLGEADQASSSPTSRRSRVRSLPTDAVFGRA